MQLKVLAFLNINVLTCLKRKIVLHVSHICVEWGLQTAFKLSRFWRHLNYFLLKAY